MDEFGFCAAALAGLELFEIQSRRTGRTSRLIERVTLDDQIVVASEADARLVHRSLRAVRKDGVRIIVCPEICDPRERSGTATQGRTFFDHAWTRAHFCGALRCADRELELLQRAMSKTWPEAPPSPDASGARMVDFIRRRW